MHLRGYGVHSRGQSLNCTGIEASRRKPDATPPAGSVIIHRFTFKSLFFILLGAFRLKRVVLVAIGFVLMSMSLLSFQSCGSSSSKTTPPSRLTNRVLAAQGVTSTFTGGGLVFIDGMDDTLARVSELSAGSSPGLMAMSPTRNLLAAFDAFSNGVYTVNTVTESSVGRVQLLAPTSSIVVPTAGQVGYAAVPTASMSGFAFLGAVEVLDLTGSVTTTIGVSNAQTVVANPGGSQLLVFSNDSNSVTVLSPLNAVPPVDTSCQSAPNSVCTIVTGFDRPVNAVISTNGTTAYILNCGAECGGTQASVQTLDLASLTVGTPVPVDGATFAFLPGGSSSTLYVAGNSLTNNSCTGQKTAATKCGRLSTIDLGSMSVTSTIAITDGYHDHMDMSVNGQLYIGSHNCTNIGDVNNPSGEVRGCLTILNTTNNTVIVPPDNGDVNGLQSFTTRNIEYVAEGGALRVYDTTKNILLINTDVPLGTINVVGYVGDVKAIDFF